MSAPNSELCETFRREMPVATQRAYFDHAAVAPWPRAARDIYAAWIDDLTANGDMNWLRWSRQVEAARTSAAKLVGCSEAEIAWVRNTTEGVNLVAEGYPWRAGDNVVTLADEFPTNLYPWMNLARRGVETRQIATRSGRFELSELDAACDGRTRIIAISWVNYATGWRNDLDALAELAHRRGALLFVDAIQGLGVFPIDVSRTPIDFLTADGHKWLIGPEGAGLFYVRREHLDRLQPLGVGWNSVAHAGDFANTEFRLKDTAARYEGGTNNLGAFLAFGASIELLLSLGVDAIAARILEYTTVACKRLEALGARIISAREGERASGIVSFELPGVDPVATRKACIEAGVVLSCRSGRLRISPHAYNNDDDLDRLIDILTATQRAR
jgi:selenocysteine lyase/cysteine desulfurase